MKVDHRSGDKYQIMAEINMVPLIDVALVLLIIFMVMTPILVASQIKLNLPGSPTGESSSKDKPIEIQVDRAGVVHFLGKIVAIESLRNKIEAVAGPSKQAVVLISADKDVPFEKVVAVMDAARLAKIQKMSIGVKKVAPPSR